MTVSSNEKNYREILNIVEQAYEKLATNPSHDTQKVYQRTEKKSELIAKQLITKLIGPNRIALISEEIRWKKTRKQSTEKHPIRQTILPSGKDTTINRESRPQAILFGLYWLQTGGAEKFAVECIKEAAKNNICVVITEHGADNQMLLQHHPNVIIAKWLKSAEDRLQLATTLLSEIDFKVIHIHHNETLYSLAKYAKEVNQRSVVIDSLHIIELGDGGFPKKSGSLTEHIDYHHVISNNLRIYLAEKYQRYHNVLLLGLNESTLQKTLPNLLKRRSNEIRITFIGRMERQKRPRLFVLSAAQIKKSVQKAGMQTRFRMQGDGSQLQKTVQLAHLNKALAIEFIPANADVKALLSDSDFLLMPSENEGVPLVAYEALKYGCIPLLSDVGACNEVSEITISAKPRTFIRESERVISTMITDERFTLSQWHNYHENLQKLGNLKKTLATLSKIYTGKFLDEKNCRD